MAAEIISQIPDREMPTSRQAAKESGSKFYFSGPCVNGHDAPRYTSIGRCSVCQQESSRKLINKDPEARLAKLRQRYSENKEAVRTKVKAWYALTLESRREYYKQRRRSPKGAQMRKVQKDWLLRNVDKDRAYQKASKQKRKEKIGEYNRAYKRSNRHRYASPQKVRQTLQMKAMPKWVDRDALDAIYAEAGRLTMETGVRHSVDHIYPLKGKTSCGLHVPWNLQILTLRENIQKGNKAPEEWRRESELEIS